MQNVLVCDDDEAILESLRIYLDNAGFNVITAVDGPVFPRKIQLLMIDGCYFILE